MATTLKYGKNNPTKMKKSRIEDRGRIVIPKSIRDSLSLKRGQQVHIDTQGDAIVIRPERSMNGLKELAGCITKENARDTIDPLHLKNIWRS